MSNSSLTEDIATELQAWFAGIYALDVNALKSGLIPGFQVEAILNDCGICLGILRKATDAGYEESDSIELPNDGFDESECITLAEMGNLSREVQASATERIFRTRIQQALLQASVWLDDLRQLEMLDEDQIALASESGVALLTVLNDARAAGISGWTTVALRSEQITLLEAEELATFIQGAAARASSTAA
jgi:hypothetical protein